MQAVVFTGVGEWVVREEPVPVPGPGEVRLKVLAAGVCGTDQHLLDGGFMASFPLIPGHEIVGEVVEAGDSASSLRVGTRVVVDSNTFCGRCDACRRGRPLYCANMRAMGCNAPGGFAEFVVADATKCHEIGELDPFDAVLAEPAACALHGVDVLALKPGSDVLIFGAGPTSQLMAQLLRVGGAARVTVAAPTASKLELARGLGADETVLINRVRPEDSLETLSRSGGYDAVIEATGSTRVLELGVELTRTGGTVLVYGLADEDSVARLRPYELFSRELTIKGSFSQAYTVSRAVELLSAGVIKTAGIVSDRVPLASFGQALANLHDSQRIKSVVVPS